MVDVGINRVEDASAKRGYRIVGDVAYDEVAPKCRAIPILFMIALICGKPKILNFFQKPSAKVKFQPLQRQYIHLDRQLKNRQREKTF